MAGRLAGTDCDVYGFGVERGVVGPFEFEGGVDIEVTNVAGWRCDLDGCR